MNKKFYEKPSLELIKLLNIDIITESEPFEEDEEDIDFGDSEDDTSNGLASNGMFGFSEESDNNSVESEDSGEEIEQPVEEPPVEDPIEEPPMDLGSNDDIVE